MPRLYLFEEWATSGNCFKNVYVSADEGRFIEI
jgi:hypothetical protein